MSTDDTGQTLVFSFDGTGNEPADADGFKQDESISNVFKLHILLGGGIEPQPAVRTRSGRLQTASSYYNGIGTRQDGATIPLLGRLYSAGRRMVKPRCPGPDLQRCRRSRSSTRPKRTLTAAYRPGDKIVVVRLQPGRSAGAQVRHRVAGSRRAPDGGLPRRFRHRRRRHGRHHLERSWSSNKALCTNGCERAVPRRRHRRGSRGVYTNADRVRCQRREAGHGNLVPRRAPATSAAATGTTALSDLTLVFMAASCQRVPRRRPRRHGRGLPPRERARRLAATRSRPAPSSPRTTSPWSHASMPGFTPIHASTRPCSTGTCARSAAATATVRAHYPSCTTR